LNGGTNGGQADKRKKKKTKERADRQGMAEFREHQATERKKNLVQWVCVILDRAWSMGHMSKNRMRGETSSGRGSEAKYRMNTTVVRSVNNPEQGRRKNAHYNLRFFYEQEKSGWWASEREAG